MRLHATALLAVAGCASPAAAPTPPAPTPPAPTVDLAPAPPIHVAWPVVDAAPQVLALGPDAGARPRVVRPGCTGHALDLKTVQQACRCNSVEMLGPVDCPYDRDADVQHLRQSLGVALRGPMVVAPGRTISIEVILANGSNEDVPVMVVDDEQPQVKLIDAHGKDALAPIVDPSCPAFGGLRSAPVAVVVIPPAGSLGATVDITAVRTRRVGSSYGLARGKLSGTDVLRQAFAGSGDLDPCRDIPAGPLPRGQYVLQVRLPLLPDALMEPLVGLVASEGIEVK
jgi:hypothetical protein